MDEPAFTPGALLPIAESSYEQELKRFKRSLVLRTLRQYGWRKAESARALGVARGYLHRLINQLDIRESDEVRSDPPAPGNSVLDTVM
jgi:DNA-binding NtrC family response regulator